MPRRIRTHGVRQRRFPALVDELAAELKQNLHPAQPIIDEFHFPETNSVKVTVVWDAWKPLYDEDRTDVIMQAYEDAEGKGYADRLVLAAGYTVPEAAAYGILPYRVVP